MADGDHVKNLQVIALSGFFAALAFPAMADTIRVGAERDFLPYSDVDLSGRATGFSVELFNAVAEAAGLTPNYQVSSWDEAWNGLLEGRLQALPLVARLPSRHGLLEFSAPHTFGYDAIFTRKNHSVAPVLESLRNRCVLVMKEDAAHHALIARGFEGELQPVKDLSSAFSRLATGHCEHVVAPIVQGTLIINSLGLKNEITIGKQLSEYRREFAFATRKGDTDLRDRLDSGLLAIKVSGEYQRIYDKWLGLYAQPAARVNTFIIVGLGFFSA